MRRIMIFFVIVSLLFTMTVALAEIPDVSDLSYEELIQLQEKLSQALWASDGWNRVNVPMGNYVIGTDIPAGRWTIYGTISQSHLWVRHNHVESLIYIDSETPVNLTLYDGDELDVNWEPVVFMRYIPVFSFE